MLVSLGLIIFSPYLAIIPMVLLVWHFARKGELEFQNVWTQGLLFLFLWSFVVGILNHQGIYTSASLVLFGFLLISVYVQDRFRTELDIERLLSWTFIFSTGSALIGVLERFQMISYSPAWWKYAIGTRSIVVIEEPNRISGTFNNPNLAGTWYAVMILIGFYFYRRLSGLKKAACLLGMGIFGFALASTESRGAVLGLFLGFVLYAYYSGHKRKMLFLMFALLSVIALMLNQPDWFPRGEILFSSIRDRQAIWQNCFDMFMMKPVTGWGLLGIYFADSHVYNYLRVFHAHNTLLTIATTLGIVGLGVFLWMLWSLFQEIRFLSRHRCRLTPLLCGIQAMIMGHGLVDFTIMSPQIGLLYVGTASFIGGLAFSYRMAAAPQRIPLSVQYRKWKKAL